MSLSGLKGSGSAQWGHDRDNLSHVPIVVKRVYAMFSLSLLKKYPVFLTLFFILFIPACTSVPTSVKQVVPNVPLNTWNKVAPGVEQRYESWKSGRGNEDTVIITRFDLKQLQIRVGYQPTSPQFIQTWLQQEKALAVINGGYFEQDTTASALVVSDGKSSGRSYRNLGGMLSVDTQGNTSLRSLRLTPYEQATEQLMQATQSFPMLVLPGGIRAQFRANDFRDARSVIATDRQGNLLFLVSPNKAFSLAELADLLITSDLSVETALNLDGGRSTGFALQANTTSVLIESQVKLPIVIIVEPRK